MIFYTDGSCKGNPGRGGYAVVILDDDGSFIDCYSHFTEETTNNIEEMKAILYVFLNYSATTAQIEWDVCQPPIVYSDSEYAINVFTNWMFKWQQYGWIKTDRKPPKNLEYIKAFYDWFALGHRINLQYTKGHSINQWNNLADSLATGTVTPEEVRRLYGKENNN